MVRLTLATALFTLLALPASAQEETMDEEASEAEMASVMESIGRIGCSAEVVEKETDDLFEIDDATCEIGQYDIKLDGEFTIISMTYDGPAEADDDDTDSAEIPQETVDSIMAMLTDMQCEMDPDDITREDGGYDLDDVICAEGGQFDITLDADLNETGRRAE